MFWKRHFESRKLCGDLSDVREWPRLHIRRNVAFTAYIY